MGRDHETRWAESPPSSVVVARWSLKANKHQTLGQCVVWLVSRYHIIILGQRVTWIETKYYIMILGQRDVWLESRYLILILGQVTIRVK